MKSLDNFMYPLVNKLVHDRPTGEPPIIVCLCGSTKFWKEFIAASLRATMEGKIVLSIGATSGTDDEHFGNLPAKEYEAVKERLDKLHMWKIFIADEVMILNFGGYIGQSTTREIDYALSLGKRLSFLEPRYTPE